MQLVELLHFPDEPGQSLVLHDGAALQHGDRLALLARKRLEPLALALGIGIEKGPQAASQPAEP
ncbi:MAG: hypothetical protein AB7I25_01735 [Vicinamibacterales bacterium]